MSNNCFILDAVILAGGQGKRMGGVQKGLIEINHKPIICYVLEKLEKQAEQVWINANQSQAIYQEFGCPVIEDKQARFLGPLEGIASALEVIEKDWLLFVPCDNPNISNLLVKRLTETYAQTPNPLIVASDGERIQPLYGLIHRSLLKRLRETIDKGHLSVMRWIKEVPHSIADFSDQKPAFQNLNTLEDIEKLKGD